MITNHKTVQMQEWSFPEAQLFKVFEIATYKGQVVRLSKTGPLLSTYNSIWNKFSDMDGWGVSALTLQLHDKIKALRLETCQLKVSLILWLSDIIMSQRGILDLKYTFISNPKFKRQKCSLLSFLIVHCEVVAYTPAIWSQEISTFEETRRVLIHQAFQNFSLKTPPRWLLSRSPHKVGNSVA